MVVVVSEHKSARALPVAVHDGVDHVESGNIMETVDRLASERASFFPRDAEERVYVKEELAFNPACGSAHGR